MVDIANLEQLIENHLRQLPKQKLEESLFRYVATSGWWFINCSPFIDLVREWVSLKQGGNKRANNNLKKLLNALENHYKPQSLKKHITDLKYWEVYLEVKKEIERIVKKEKSKELHFAISEACRRVSDRKDLKFNTVRARFNDKQKEAKKFGLDDDDIRKLISEFGSLKFSPAYLYLLERSMGKQKL